MASILKEYNVRKGLMMKEATSGAMEPGRMLQLQEILYRVSVLETCMCLCETAPVTEDVKMNGYHYQVVDACLESMLNEHRIGLPADEECAQRREAAREKLHKVIQHSRRQFSSFVSKGPEHYKTCIVSTINNIVPVWMQYRNTYTRI